MFMMLYNINTKDLNHTFLRFQETARLTDQSVPNSNRKSLNQLVFFAILVSTIGVRVGTLRLISSWYS